MRIKSIVRGIITMLALGTAVVVLAQEQFGVKIYPGAQADATTTNAVKKMTKQDAACYRTADTVTKVNEFYKQQPGLKTMGTSPEDGAFSKGASQIDVMITVQSPWMDTATGKMMKDTLITFVNQKK